MVALVEKKPSSSMYTQGAIALVKSRAQRNFESKFSRKLYIGVMTHVAATAFQNARPVELPPVEWASTIARLPFNPASRLSLLSQQVANIRASAITILSGSEPNQTPIQSLIGIVLHVEKLLVLWRNSIPPHWQPQVASDQSPAALLRFDAYGSRMDVYSDLWVASTYNSYRLHRLALSQLLISCLNKLGTTFRPPAPFGPLVYHVTIQQMADEICASVPFLAGDRSTSSNMENVTYPWFFVASPTSEHRKAAIGVGSWFLMAPLQACLQMTTIPTLAEGMDSTTIDEVECHLSFRR